jgi:hypothetical protein
VNEDQSGKHEGNAANNLMVQQMEERRKARSERRRPRSAPPAEERRRLCEYCFQRGDHPSPMHCLRALER